MTRDELLTEIERLSAVCSKPLGEQETQRRTAFLTELERKFLWLTQAQWRDVVTWVIDNHKTRALPTIEEFSRGVSALRSNGKIQGFQACESCIGSAQVYGRFRHIPSGKIVDAMVPCPACRGYVQTRIKPDLEFVDDNLSHLHRLAYNLSPARARNALNLGTFDEETTVILVERSTQPDEEPLRKDPLPTNVDAVGDRMGQIMENKRLDQQRFIPKRAPPKAEWVQPIDAQSRAAGEQAP